MGRRPHIRAATGTGTMLGEYFLATVPAVLIGIWNLGAQVNLRESIASGASANTWLGDFGQGLLIYWPLLSVSLVAAVLWASLFAKLRLRPVDASWWLNAWLFAALVPPSLPAVAAFAGISFGFVFGSQIFGGAGRYPLSPVLLGVLFLRLGYPDYFAAGGWLPGFDDAPTWAVLAVDEAALTGQSWYALALGREIGTVGAPPALACLAGGLFLVVRGWASARTLLGAILGLWLGGWLVGNSDAAVAALPWYWHLAVGNVAFILAFIATDPSTQSLTRAGRWLHGIFAGLLVVFFRVTNPEHPEGSLYAFTFACLTTPLFDYAVLAFAARTKRRSASG